MTDSGHGGSVLGSEGVRRLLKNGGKKLTDDERALLLALIEADAAHLNEDEQAALDQMRAQLEDYDAEELSRAVDHMVTAKPRRGRKLKWPELKSKLREWRERKKD